MREADHFLSWPSQRRYDETVPAREFAAMGNAAQPGEPLSVGAWPAEDRVCLWDQLPNRRDSWPLTIVFNGRLFARFSRRICQDGTLVSREVPKFTDIDKAVSLVKIGDSSDPEDKQISWSIVFNHEWASYV
eukprot:6665770-Pyramimonas_sp.AAC.1